LAKDLGMTVQQLNDNMTQDEFVGWVAFYELAYEDQQKMLEDAKRNRRRA
jgi:PIN domain nuclease of toxin-antitoxin system